MEPTGLSTMTAQLLLFCIALCCCALFSFLETVITAMRLYKLKEFARSTGKYQTLFSILEKHPHRILITILVANNLANTTCGAVVSRLMENLFAKFHLSESIGFSVGIALASMAILIFGEIIPKNFARAMGERVFTSTLWIINLLFYLLYPFVNFLVKFSNAVIYQFSGKKAGPTDAVASEKEIQFMIDYITQKGLMETEKTTMLKSIFALGQKPVKEILVPVSHIISIGTHASLEDCLMLFTKYQFSRLPLYENTPDNIIGIIYQKDLFMLLSQGKKKPLKDLVRPVLFAPETLKVNQLLKEFKKQHMHMAMVVNEYGNIEGLVTLEDVLEEIVGDIRDEHELVEEKVVPLKEGGFLIDATLDLVTLGHVLGITFEAEDAVTLAGFLTERLQHLPHKGEKIIYKNYAFQVQQANAKRVAQVIITLEPTEAVATVPSNEEKEE